MTLYSLMQRLYQVKIRCGEYEKKKKKDGGEVGGGHVMEK